MSEPTSADPSANSWACGQQPPPVAKILTAKLAAMKEIATTGVGKWRKNIEQKFDFRGAEDVINIITPCLINAGIVVRVEHLERIESYRDTRSGSKMKNIAVLARVTFTSVEDGSSEFTTTWGEAEDTTDKATSKAQTVALRTALLETFVVPFSGVWKDPEDDTSGAGGAGDTAGPSDGADGSPPSGIEETPSAKLARYKKEVRALKTDAEMLAFYKDRMVEFRGTRAYDEFKADVVAARTELKAKTGDPQ